MNYETTDLWFAAYLKLLGYEVVDYVIVGSKKVKYRFNLEAEQLKEIRLKYLASELSKCKQLIEELKDLAY